jgi:IclR family transcriptional regulator, KDG regulon repressor
MRKPEELSSCGSRWDVVYVKWRLGTKVTTSIQKVAQVLGVFRTCPSVGIRELARKTGLAPSDVHRIVASLAEIGYLEQEQSRKYSLGLEFLKLGRTAHQYSTLCRQATPFLRRLSEMAEVTVNLAIIDRREEKAFFVEQVDSLELLEIQYQVGSEASPYATSVGKVLFAHLASDAMNLRLKQSLQSMTRHTITDFAALEREFDNVRLRGYAIDREEVVNGICCVGTPVVDATGHVVAAISASVPASRLDGSEESMLIAATRTTAAKLSRALDGSQSCAIGKPCRPVEE